MYINRHNKVTRQYGFSLWELSIVMLIMIGLFVALINVMPHIVKREHVEVDNSILVKMDDQLLGFIATYYRLPCPDDGFENCSGNNSTGAIPYKTLGLNEDYVGVGSIPVQYAVFRNATDMADLANITDLFNPTDSHANVTTLNNVNGLDFCSAIANSKASTFSNTYAHIILPGGITRAVPYVIVTAGLTNSDGGTSPFDGVNATAALDFESANKEHNVNYDDTVFTKSFDDLASTLNCDTVQNSLNLLANAKVTHEDNLVTAESLRASATLSGVILGAQILLGIANTALSTFTLAAAVTTLTTASALLSSAIASCAVLVGCALIPVYTTGVVASIVAISASGVAIGLSVTALITQTVAIALVIDVAARAGATISLPEESTDPNNSNTTVSNAEIAAQVRLEAEKLKADSAEKIINARDTINDTRGSAETIQNSFNNIKNQAQTLANTTTAVNDGLFTNYSLASNNQAQTNLNQANSALSNTISAKSNADDAVVALGTAGNSGVPPFTVTYPNANFPLIVSHLGLADPKMTTAATAINNLRNSYLNIKTQATNAKNRIITLKAADPYPTPVNPTNPTAAELIAINNWNIRRDILDDAQAKAQDVIDSMNVERAVLISDLQDRRDAAVTGLNRIIEIRDALPVLQPGATAAQIAERNTLLTLLNVQQAEQQTLINYYNGILSGSGLGLAVYYINRLQDDIEIGVGQIVGAQASTTEAFGTISSALNAEENATYFENNVGSGLPNPTTTLLTQAGGVDDILRAADAKGVQQ